MREQAPLTCLLIAVDNGRYPGVESEEKEKELGVGVTDDLDIPVLRGCLRTAVTPGEKPEYRVGARLASFCPELGLVELGSERTLDIAVHATGEKQNKENHDSAFQDHAHMSSPSRNYPDWDYSSDLVGVKQGARGRKMQKSPFRMRLNGLSLFSAKGRLNGNI